MTQSDKDMVALVVNFFILLGATEEQARKACFSRNPSMHGWMIWWLGKNTDYNQTKVLTDDMRKMAFYAWIHYKATTEIIGGADVSQEKQE